MATALKETIASLIQTVYANDIARTIIETAPAFARLQDKGKVVTDKRTYLRWPCVSEAYGGAANINDGGTIPAADHEDYNAAVMNYKVFIAPIRVGRVMQLGAQNAEEFFATEAGARELVNQINPAMRQLTRRIHTQLVAAAGQAAPNLIGFGDAVGSTTNTYAGINRTTATYWQPYISAGGAALRSLTEILMRDMFDNLTDNRGAIISEIWAGTTAYNALIALLDTRVRYPESETLKGGTTVIYWNGIPVVRMPGMDANTMWWLDFESDDGIMLKRQHDQDFIVREESTGSYDVHYTIAGHYELVVHNPFKQGALTYVQ